MLWGKGCNARGRPHTFAELRGQVYGYFSVADPTKRGEVIRHGWWQTIVQKKNTSCTTDLRLTANRDRGCSNYGESAGSAFQVWGSTKTFSVRDYAAFTRMSASIPKLEATAGWTFP